MEGLRLYSDFNIHEFTQQLQNSCAKAQTKIFQKGDTITSYIKNRNQVCILKTGLADLVRYDVNGNKTIVDTEYYLKLLSLENLIL
jgi:hypothetical protein